MRKSSLLLLLSIISFSVLSVEKQYRLLIGTYTQKDKSEGIYNYSVDLKRGVFTLTSVAKGIDNPSYMAISKDKTRVYCVNECGEASGVSAFSFNSANGQFGILNCVKIPWADPCFLTVTPKHIFTANYSGGSLSVLRIGANGELAEPIQQIDQKALSEDRGSHVHQTILSPDGKFLFVNNLGTDMVSVYRYYPNSKKKVLVLSDSLKVKSGSGPRHLTFSKDGSLIYLLHELDGTLSVLSQKDGKLKMIQETTVVQNKNVKTGAADIHLSPDGRFVYATNRGTANDISCFAVEPNGSLKFVSQVSVLGDGPRNFAITPDGDFLLVANQRSNQVVVFCRNKTTGALTDSGFKLNLDSPVCLVFY